MIVELYAVPTTEASATVESPISSTTGELPDQEPTLDLGDLLGSFDSREEAVASIEKELSTHNQSIADSKIVPFDAYTHVELLTITLRSEPQSTRHYYLVSDEGY